MIDRTVRNAAAITVAVGALLLAPFLSVVAARNESQQPVPRPRQTRVISVPSPVASIESLPPGQAAKANGHGHHHGPR